MNFKKIKITGIDGVDKELDWLYSVSRFLLIGIYTSIIAVINPLRPTIVLIFLFALFDRVIGYGWHLTNHSW